MACTAPDEWKLEVARMERVATVTLLIERGTIIFIFVFIDFTIVLKYE